MWEFLFFTALAAFPYLLIRVLVERRSTRREDLRIKAHHKEYVKNMGLDFPGQFDD